MIAVERGVLFLCVLLLLAPAPWPAEGRYLPTRSDNTRFEHIKDILRALLDLNETEMHSGKQSGYPYEDAYRTKRGLPDERFGSNDA